jgi:hypothetical protein
MRKLEDIKTRATKQKLHNLEGVTARLNLQRHIPFDKNKLDDAIQEQSQLFLEVANGLANATSEKDGLKHELEDLEAELSQKLRKEYARKNEKFTENGLREEVSLKPNCLRLRKELTRAKSEADHWFALKEAFLQRSYMLKEQAALFIAGYFMQDSVKTSNERKVIEKGYDTKRAKLRRTLKA